MAVREAKMLPASLHAPALNLPTPETEPHQIISGITHDLRGPLFALMGYLELIHRNMGDTGPGKAVEYLGLAREAGMRLNQMLDQMLDIFRAEQGPAAMALEPVPLERLFKLVWNTFNL